MSDGDGFPRPQHGYGQSAARAPLASGAEFAERIGDPSHRSGPERTVSGECRGDFGRRHRAHEQADAGSGVAAVDDVIGLGEAAGSDAVNAPLARRASFDSRAEPLDRFRGRKHVVGFKQPCRSRFACGQGG